MKTQKTGESVILPCLAPVKELYLKYGGKFPKAPSNQKFNANLKVLGKLAGIVQEIVISITRNGQVCNEKFLKYQLMTTHTGRRNAITNLYLLGVQENTLMKISGHKKIENLRKYIKCSDVQHIGLIYDILQKKRPELLSA